MGGSSSVLNAERAKLSKEGKQMLDDSLMTCEDLSEEERQVYVEAQLKVLLVEKALPQVQFIDFDWFKAQGEIPRCPDCLDGAVPLDSINRADALMIFVSHTWLRGWSGAEGWDGRPHPDNANNDKFALICKGVESIWGKMARKMKKCYLWIDFACVNQDMNPGGQMEQLDKVMQCCDLVFTPIVNKDEECSGRGKEVSVSLSDRARGTMLSYDAKDWNNGPQAYLNRAWCRLEMMYAANIPAEVGRHTSFEQCLQRSCRMNRRPHFLFGDNELRANKPPKALPPLQRNFASHYPPLEGFLSVMSDFQNIAALLEDLKTVIDAHGSKLGYIGDTNPAGNPHGRGVTHYPSGDVFEGEWLNGHSHGQGTYKWANGDVYEGHFENGKMHGKGVIRSANGEVFEGEFREGLLQMIGQ